MDQLPPSRARVLEVRAAGVRPRSGLLGLAGVALGLAGLLALGLRLGSWSIEAREPSSAIDVDGLALGSGAALLLLLGVLLFGCRELAERGATRRRLGVGLEFSTLAGPTRAALGLLAIALLVFVDLGALAGAARSVDASAEALGHSWSGWAIRGLLGLAIVAALVGGFERWLSGRRLWRALHLTPSQVREQARASASHARRGLG